MKNIFVLNSRNTSGLSPLQAIKVIIVASFNGVDFHCDCPNVTYLDTFDFVSDGKKIYVQLKSCTAKHAIEWIQKWINSRRPTRFACGNNAVGDDLDSKSEKWYYNHYYSDIDFTQKTRRTKDSYDQDPDDELSLSEITERESTTANVYDRYFYNVERANSEYDNIYESTNDLGWYAQ